MSAEHVEKEQARKGWARPKPMSDCLCTQRPVNTVQHLACYLCTLPLDYESWHYFLYSEMVST